MAHSSDFFHNIMKEVQLFEAPSHSSNHYGTSNLSGSDESKIGSPLSLANNKFCNEKYVNNGNPIILNESMNDKTTTICYQAFTVMYSGITRTPLWSAEHLTKDNVLSGKSLKRENNFYPEERLPSNERAELSDFKGSGCDRGHMSPNKDMPNRESANQSFSLANMIPQNPNNNQILWEGIESVTRAMAIKYDDVYVMNIPVFLGDNIKTLHGRVMIPTNIIKAIYIPSLDRAAAYYVQNRAGMDYNIISIAKAEQISGINLFPGLNNKVSGVSS